MVPITLCIEIDVLDVKAVLNVRGENQWIKKFNKGQTIPHTIRFPIEPTTASLTPSKRPSSSSLSPNPTSDVYGTMNCDSNEEKERPTQGGRETGPGRTET
jgi:hypothetical protein